MPMQVDGEPRVIPPCTLHIRHKYVTCAPYPTGYPNPRRCESFVLSPAAPSHDPYKAVTEVGLGSLGGHRGRRCVAAGRCWTGPPKSP